MSITQKKEFYCFSIKKKFKCLSKLTILMTYSLIIHIFSPIFDCPRNEKYNHYTPLVFFNHTIKVSYINVLQNINNYSLTYNNCFNLKKICVDFVIRNILRNKLS